MGIWNRIKARLTSSDKYMKGPRPLWWFRGGTVVNEDASMQVAAFNRGVIYISTQLAKLPWNIKDNTNAIVENPVSNLLNLAFNPEMNSFRGKLFLIQQAILFGNGYAEIERNIVGTPVALWPLDSVNMELLRADNGDLIYKYHNPSGAATYLRPRDVFHLPNFHMSKDGIQGQGVATYGREVLGIQIAADNMAASLFQNSGIPSGILQHPGKLSDAAYKRLKDSWAEQTGGKKTASTSVLEEGMVYNPVNVAPNLLQFLESRQFGVLEIARFLGVPPTKLFDITAATYSNVENANLEVATDTLDSWAINMEMEADVKLLNYRYGGRYSDIDLYAIFRGDMKSRSDYFKTMISIGAMTPNQARAREGLPGYGPDGDNYYIPTNNLTPVRRLDEVIDADIKSKNKPPAAPATKTPQDLALEEAATKYLTGSK